MSGSGKELILKLLPKLRKCTDQIEEMLLDDTRTADIALRCWHLVDLVAGIQQAVSDELSDT